MVLVGMLLMACSPDVAGSTEARSKVTVTAGTGRPTGARGNILPPLPRCPQATWPRPPP